ncbi:uncharacterized protein MELLADRAFT_86565 [Melampsora larici-populina 98AG31]|uniref:Uncharacterized protein n=1 Tax=Melampsora larici-populina (strain 98AG31 / pathotype 3-4-7) TaxID=747676 RepID=F4RM92_MELLP|nr:uncharacterized protein MELLADRAFT_86565 [Melampsora larici-populina 98AG31]EGG06380.1 hypothetical protein MELLADRAFT_86565 [Melampsora larici-populina 98AG31]
MADPSESTPHGLYLTGNFEIEKKFLKFEMQTSPENGWRSEYQTYATYIGAGGAHRKRTMSYKIQIKGYSPAQFRLDDGNIYFLRGSFFPSNTDETKNDILFFEGSERILIGPADTIVGDLVNSIAVTGVGIVTAKETIPKPNVTSTLPNPADGEKLVTIVTVLHSDYHLTLKKARQFKVQYRIPPTPNLAGIQKILQEGREYVFHGFLKDFDEEKCLYIIMANKISPTTGSKEYNVGVQSTDATQDNMNSRLSSKKPTKFVPRALTSQFMSPVISTDSESSLNLQFPPSDFGPSSFSSAMSSTTPGTSNGSSDNALSNENPNPPSKKKGRAQPKRVTKKSKTMDFTIEE